MSVSILSSPSSHHPKPWTTEEAAGFLRVHPRTLTRMAKRGEIPAFRIGAHWRFLQKDIDEWIKRRVTFQQSSILSAATRKGDI